MEITASEGKMMTTAVVRIVPEKDEKVIQLLNEITSARAAADRFVVNSPESVKMATDDLSLINRLKKTLTAERREYVDPLNALVKDMNNAFKKLSDPLDEADTILRGKVIAYKVEQERRRLEAEEINRQAIELAKKQAELNHGEFTVDTTPVNVPEAPRLTRTELGLSSMVKARKYRIIDFAKLPDQYKIENSVLLNKVVRAGIPEIPGVEIYIEESLRVTTQ